MSLKIERSTARSGTPAVQLRAGSAGEDGFHGTVGLASLTRPVLEQPRSETRPESQFSDFGKLAGPSWSDTMSSGRMAFDPACGELPSLLLPFEAFEDVYVGLMECENRSILESAVAGGLSRQDASELLLGPDQLRAAAQGAYREGRQALQQQMESVWGSETP